nr:PREDICTED: folate receptor gamma-like [Bemisia tabaci]
MPDSDHASHSRRRLPRWFIQVSLGFTAMIIVLLACLPLISSKTAYAPEVLNYCIDGKYHKKLPGPEPGLYGECSPWANRACCHSKTTYNAHHQNSYRFNWDHCGHVKNMSDLCRVHFLMDVCFYECSPNVGFWVVKETRGRKYQERFFGVPLCRSDCDSWFDACRNDYTCGANWGQIFDYKNGVNYCREGSQCRTFHEVYGNSTNFCQKVWDHSWKVTPNDQPCMRMSFNNSMDNPNDRVAWYYVYKANGSTKGNGSASLICSFILALLFLYFQSQRQR